MTQRFAAIIFALVLTGCAAEALNVEARRPTAICLDGTHSYSPHSDGTCASHDGVSLWMDVSRHGRSESSQ